MQNNEIIELENYDTNLKLYCSFQKMSWRYNLENHLKLYRRPPHNNLTFQQILAIPLQYT